MKPTRIATPSRRFRLGSTSTRRACSGLSSPRKISRQQVEEEYRPSDHQPRMPPSPEGGGAIVRRAQRQQEIRRPDEIEKIARIALTAGLPGKRIEAEELRYEGGEAVAAWAAFSALRACTDAAFLRSALETLSLRNPVEDSLVGLGVHTASCSIELLQAQGGDGRDGF